MIATVHRVAIREARSSSCGSGTGSSSRTARNFFTNRSSCVPSAARSGVAGRRIHVPDATRSGTRTCCWCGSGSDTSSAACDASSLDFKIGLAGVVELAGVVGEDREGADIGGDSFWAARLIVDEDDSGATVVAARVELTVVCGAGAVLALEETLIKE